jgi:hypothetical protein
MGVFIKEIVWLFTCEEDEDDRIGPVVVELYQRLADLSNEHKIIHEIEGSLAASLYEAELLAYVFAQVPDLVRHFRGAS